MGHRVKIEKKNTIYIIVYHVQRELLINCSIVKTKWLIGEIMHEKWARTYIAKIKAQPIYIMLALFLDTSGVIF